MKNVNFGNFLQTSVHGYKFHDLNGNGLDDGEPRLEGWTIELVGVDGQGNAVSVSTVTDVDGEYAFTELGPGTYTVSEQLQTGWTQTAGGTTFTLESGQEVVAIAGRVNRRPNVGMFAPFGGSAPANSASVGRQILGPGSRSQPFSSTHWAA